MTNIQFGIGRKAFLIAAAVLASSMGAAHAQSLQEKFNTATEAFQAGDCAKAVPLFKDLQSNPAVKPNTIPGAAIAVRMGQCILENDPLEADEPAIVNGLQKLAEAGSEFDIDVSNGWAALGNAAYERYDYEGAKGYYLKGIAYKTGADRLGLLAKLANATAFDGTADALLYAEEGLSILSAPDADKELKALFYTFHGRTLLNLGQVDAAYEDLKQALSLRGGLSYKEVSLVDVSLRNDLAMAAMLRGKEGEAKNYLVYTGAGRIPEAELRPATYMEAPICGAETGLRPSDTAIVQLNILDDGGVGSARTMYTRGDAAVARAFGEAVSRWYWDPALLAKVPAFYKALVRVEVRCSTVLGGGPGMGGPFKDRFVQWALPLLKQSDADLTIGKLRQIHARFYKDGVGQGDPRARIAILGWLSSEYQVGTKERLGLVNEALLLTLTTSVPDHVVNWLNIERYRAKLSAMRRYTVEDLQGFINLANEPNIAKDAIASDTAKLFAARGYGVRELPNAAEVLLEVAEDNRLDQNHPLRQIAWLKLADNAAKANDRKSAEQFFAQSGLTAEQCSMLGEAPRLRKTNVNSADFPMDAWRMGFGGWVHSEFDIMTSGRTSNVRALAAYPPLIFINGANAIADNLRYEESYRPDGPVACSANAQTISFSR